VNGPPRDDPGDDPVVHVMQLVTDIQHYLRDFVVGRSVQVQLARLIQLAR
jgi:hypothetical protein